MAANKQILIVDRDVACVEPLRQKLSDAGYIVQAIADGNAAMAILAQQPPHLVILDWSTSGGSPLELIQVVRDACAPRTVRVIILSSRATEQDVVKGFELGADDYIAKPFSVREVVARVAAVLRIGGRRAAKPALSCDGLVLDASAKRVMARGRPLNLRGVEYRLLEFLMSHPGQTLTRTQLLVQVWGDDSAVDERTVDVNVQRLRKLLTEPGYEAYIQTVRGFGYRFAGPTGVAGVPPLL